VKERRVGGAPRHLKLGPAWIFLSLLSFLVMDLEVSRQMKGIEQFFSLKE
jgi:hypothetical protein